MSAPSVKSVLFVCYLNSIRSPMAEGLLRHMTDGNVYIESCGLEAGELDDFMVSVMREKGIDMSSHTAQTLEEFTDTQVELVIAFTEQAGEAAKAVFANSDTEIEVWPTPDPTAGMLDVRALLNNYRSVRDFLEGRLKKRFDV